MKKKRKSLKFITIVSSLIALGYVIAANIVSSNFFVRTDLTENKIFSISETTRNRLRGLQDVLTIELYFSDNLPQNLRQVQSEIIDLTDEFRSVAGRNIRVVHRKPDRNTRDREEAFALRIPAVEVQTIQRDRREMVQGYMGIALRYGAKSESIPFVQTTDNIEFEIVQRIIRLTKRELPTVGIIKTDTAMYVPPEIAQWYAMEIPEDITHRRFRALIHALEQLYNVEYIDLTQVENIGDHISTIIVPGENEASYFVHPQKIYAIDQFLMRGGNVIVLAQRFAVNLQRDENVSLSNTLLYNMLEAWGVVVEPKLIQDASAGTILVPTQVGGGVRNVPTEYPFWVRVNEDGFNRNVAPLAAMRSIIFPWASPVMVSPNLDSATIADTLIMSSQYSVLRAAPLNENMPPLRIAPNQNWEFFFERAMQDGTLMRYPMAIRLSGRINSVFSDTTFIQPLDERELLLYTTRGTAIIIGNADFLSAEVGTPQNLPLLMNLVDWLTLDDDLITVRSRNMIDRSLQQFNMMGGANFNNATLIRVLNIVLMPLIIVIVGLALFIKRKKQQNERK
ncbi:MAG: GldG family protein [Chitinivibrionia bacterium]|nr:GldG family protein [Chitinivibrionia bacterium]